MAANVIFAEMTKADMKQWCTNNPTRVDDRDRNGCTLLYTAAMNDYTGLVVWLVDEKGANVQRTMREDKTPLHRADSPEMITLLLTRGADVTTRNACGWTPLMNHLYWCRSDCVERLLQESKVIETIDAQSTANIYLESRTGSTALHLACSTHYENMTKNRIIKMLLRAGADPTIFNAQQETPLDTFRRCRPSNHAGIALLELATIEPQRTLLLAKAREINDANDVIAKAKEEAQRKVLASTPTFLQGRVREQQQQQQHLLLGPPLPRVELHGPPPAVAHTRTGNEKEEEAEKMRHATLQYVLRAPELGETGGCVCGADGDDDPSVGPDSTTCGWGWRE